MYQAWDQAEPRKRIALASKAPTISPLCADAYVLLAEEKAKSAKEALEYYRKGVDAGSRALGTKAFNEYEGHFWGFLETRPYMRARAGLAATLDALGDVEAAIGHYRDMLRLNPGDNQGIRYVLARCFMKAGISKRLGNCSSSSTRMALDSGYIRGRLSLSGTMEPEIRRRRNWRERLARPTGTFPPL
jgi:tetratricopeptide (TPR) repeat protein